MSKSDKFEIINTSPLPGTKWVSCQITKENDPPGSDCITVAAAPLWMVQVLVKKANLYKEYINNAESDYVEVS